MMMIENATLIEDVDAITVKALQIERLESILEQANKNNDIKYQLKVIDMLNKIYQLYVGKQEVDVTMKDMQFKFGDE